MILRKIALAAGLVLMAKMATADPSFWRHEWPDTDFTQTSVKWIEILSGGPPKDGIPALNEASYMDVAKETGIGDREPVITLELDGSVPRAYPIRYLTWHEIVNDVVDGTPVAVTFCPLCNSGIVFDRRVKGELRTFGVSGKLRNSDMVMFDRETESWWQQAIGEGIVGHHTGDTLIQIPAWMESFAEFKARNPDGLIMMQPGYPRRYGSNPYVNYDSSSRPFLYSGEMPPHDIPPLMRVVRVGDRAWPLSRLREASRISEAGVTITWNSGQASALDSGVIQRGKDVGTIRVRDANGKDVAHDVMFAFAFHAFWPEGTWMIGG